MEYLAGLLKTAAALASSAVATLASRLGIRRNRNYRSGTRTTAYLAILLSASGASFAQQDGDQTGEFSIMTGAAFGGMGTHPTVAGSAGVSLTRFTMVTVDASVMPAGRDTLLPANSLNISGSDLFTFGVAVQARIPISRWEPYVLLEPALLVNSYTAGEPAGPGQIAPRGNRHSKFGLEGGAGVRYYVKPKWGVRAEYRYISSTKNFSEIKTGVFYQIDDYAGFHFGRTFNRLLEYVK